MKGATSKVLLSTKAAGMIVLTVLPAHAQLVAIPISNGNFALRGTGGDTIYSTPLTVLSPAGTINLTAVPLPASIGAPQITTNTAIGFYFPNVSGSASLNDGRTANFPNGQGYLKLETLGTVTGAANSFFLPTAAGVTINYTVRAGSLVVPEATVSAYPTTQFNIPVTGGTFTINTPNAAQADAIAVNGLITPVGTANLTLTLPDLSSPNTPDVFMIGSNQPLLLTGLVNGTVDLNDGRTATVTDQLVTLKANGQIVAGNNFWYGEQLPGAATTIQGTISGGTINVPETAVALPQPPQLEQPQPPTQVVPPSQSGRGLTLGQFVQSVLNETQEADAIGTRPIPNPAITLSQFDLSLANGLTLGEEQNEFSNEEQQSTSVADLPDVDRYSLEFSSIHPQVNVYN